MNTVNIPQLGEVARAVEQLRDVQVIVAQRQEAMQVVIDNVAATGDQTRAELQALMARFDHFARQEELRHNLQVAHTELIEVRQRLEREFGHFDEVRRLATGTLQALDAGIVSRAAMRRLSEELMLLTPRYWLAPALVGLAAWVRDDADLAFRALAEAVRRDHDKTSLFFAIVLRRNGRDAAAVRWIRQYVVRQDPARLHREFVVVLDAVSCGVFGQEAKQVVLAETARWVERLSDDAAVVDRQVDRWAVALDSLRRPIDPRYQVLPSISPTWPQLKELYEGATVHGSALELLRSVFAGAVPLSADLRERVDTILDGLVTNHDAEEAPLRRAEAEKQAVIDARGDEQAALAALRHSDPARDVTTDFLTMISNAGIHPEESGASPGTRRFAIAAGKDWITQAAGRLEVRNTTAVPQVVDLVLEGWQGRVDGTADEDALAADLGRHIDAETERAVAQVRFVGKPLALAVSGALALVLALGTALGGDAGSAIFFLLVAAALGGWSCLLGRGIPARREELRRQGRERKAIAVARLRGGLAELVDLHRDWQAALAVAPELRDHLAGLDSSAFALNAPDQRRGL
ncbi:hypothetical protein [Actinosynnema sp. NPDC020468]|uniref:hypothetical protein n=1 Tax=Actinosynnema sp. NPDC020468 TaxID=3154488 RepID=UPI003400A50B